MFSPIGHEVEVIIHAGASGPEESHLRFWGDLEERWPTLKKECEPMLRSALKDWIDEVDREDLWSRLEVETLDVFPNITPNEWDITFWCEEAGHWPTISMKGWSPEGCYIDG